MATPTKIIKPDGTEGTGYIIGGTTYKDAAGTQRIDSGTKVYTAGGVYQYNGNGKSSKVSTGSSSSGTSSGSNMTGGGTSGGGVSGGGGTSGGSSSGGNAGTSGNGTYRQNFDYSAEAYRLAMAGDYDGAYRMLFGTTDSRAAKLAATGGNDYGLSNLDIWNDIYGMKLANEPSYDYEQGWEDYALDSLVSQITGMSYDEWVNSDQYRALADRYSAQGRMAMEDVLGQVASRTGGLASSYATTAASQQYNDYMSLLEQIAREAYSNERGELIENAGLLSDYSDRNYGRYMDKLSYDNADREFLYNYMQDQRAEERNEETDAYNREQTEKNDAISRIVTFMENGGNIEELDPELIAASGLSKAEIAQLGAISKDDARSRIEVYLGAGGKLSGLDPALVAASGLTQAELAQLEKYYAEQEVATGTASSSGGSKKSGGGGGSYDAIVTEAKGIGDKEKTKTYLEGQVDKGNISEEQAAYIFTSVCGYRYAEDFDPIPGSGQGKVNADGKISVGLPLVSRVDFTNGTNNGGLARQEFGSYDEYERAWYEFNS